MGIITSQKTTTYYERFRAIDVTFSKEIIQVMGLLTQQVYLKCGSDFWPCVIYSASFEGAKVVSNLKSGILEKLRQSGNSVSLRFCFQNSDKGGPVAFFVSTRSTGFVPHGNSSDMGIFSLQFTQRPPDALIQIMGRLLEANINSAKRKEERILLSADTQRKMALISKETAVFIQGVPRRCILRDLSFSGGKVIMVGVAKFLEGRDASLRLDFDDPRNGFLIKGKFIRSELVEGRKDLVAMALSFEESLIPLDYKLRLNDYLSLIRPPEVPSEAQGAAGGEQPGAATASAGPGPEGAAPAQGAPGAQEAAPVQDAPGGAAPKGSA